MLHAFSRTQLLLGKEGMERLYRARVAVFGIGGVGGYTVEALARSGVGTLDLIDDDRVCLTNVNRQLLATRRTVGQKKVELARQRVAEIAPDTVVNVYETFYGPDQARAAGCPIISCMGTGNKLDPTAFEVADICETSVCPLARVMRRELRKRGVDKLKVVYSKEPPLQPEEDLTISCKAHCICPPETARTCLERRQVPGSTAFVPAVAGMILAGEVIKALLLRNK